MQSTDSCNPVLSAIRCFKSFIKEYGLVEHNVRSFDSSFVDSIAPLILSYSTDMYSKTITVRLLHPWLKRVSDSLACIRATVIVESEDKITYTLPEVSICNIPVMAGSDLARRMKCDPKCPAGSFLVHNAEGTESAKVILSQERHAPNYMKFRFHQCTVDGSSIKYSFATADLSSSNGSRRNLVSVSIGVHKESFALLKNAKRCKIDEIVTGKARQLGVLASMGIRNLPKLFNVAVIVAACWKIENPADSSNRDGEAILYELLESNGYTHELAPTIESARALLSPLPFTCQNSLAHLKSIYSTARVKARGNGDGGEHEAEEAEDGLEGDSLEASIRAAFPHLSKGSSVAKYLAYMVGRLMGELERPKDLSAFLVGKDHTESKRYDSAGELLDELFRASLNATKRILCDKIKNKRNIPLNDLQTKVQYAFADANDVFWNAIRTGRWYSGIPRRAARGQGERKWLDAYGNTATPRCGVCQALPIDNPISSISLRRRIVSPLSNSATLSKIDKPRMIDPMSIGRICAAETPDGSDVGLIKNLALSGTLSVRDRGVHDAFCAFATSGPKPPEPPEPPKTLKTPKTLHETRVFVDGDFVAVWGFNCTDTAECFRAYRSSPAVSVFWRAAPCIQTKRNEVHVWTDSGRLVMPVIKKGSRGNDWMTLVASGRAFLCDAAEEESIRLDWGEPGEYDYFVPYPRGILGVPASLIPFANHSQGPRLQYSASMMKQSIFPGLLNPHGEDRKYSLDFCQRPLVESLSSHFMEEGLSFTGVNAQVAVMIDKSGFAQEDAIIFNRSSLQRGLLSAAMRNVFEDIVHCQNESYDLGKPGLGGKTLQSVKTLKVGDMVKPPNAFQITPLRGRIVKIEHIKSPDDKIANITTIANIPNIQKSRIIKSHVSTTCVPIVGDKFTSRHGQKGTISRAEFSEDLPFDEEDGMVPDIIINPHAFPSRMTEGQHIEGVIGMSAAKRGTLTREGVVDTSPESVMAHLVESGFVDGGRRVLRCGRTGEMFRVKVMIAPVYYNRLHHLVENKARVRGVGGRIDPLTQQPAKGRKNGGGIRLGEMEVHAILAQGANEVLEDRLYDSSPFMAPIEESTGTFLYDTVPPREFSKDNVDQGHSVNHVRMPYSTKLLFQEMQALGIRAVMK